MSAQTTRDQIIEAADLLFYRQGYEHNSFADIAGAVEISRGNFYYHVKSKDEILDVRSRGVSSTHKVRWSAGSQRGSTLLTGSAAS